MARIRSVKPEFWTAEQVMELSRDARLAFIGLWNFCDDAGIHPASEKTLKAELFPGDDLTSADVRRMIDELLANGLLTEYEIEGKGYWQVTGWHHQKIDQPTFKHPTPDGRVPEGAAKRRAEKAKESTAAPENSPNTSRTFAECSPNTSGVFAECSPPEGNGEERKGKYTPDKPAKFDPRSRLVELGVADPILSDWLTLRKKQKAEPTETAIVGIQREAEKAGVSLQTALETCCVRGWRGFKAEWVAGTGLPPAAMQPGDPADWRDKPMFRGAI